MLSHTYIFYPVLINFLAKKKKTNSVLFDFNAEQLPSISIIMAAYNEEKVIAEKIKSVFNTSYPFSKIEFLIGSDNSTDNTNMIVNQLIEKFPQISLHIFPARTGKAGIINKLAEKAQNDILILTDANVIFSENTLFNLVKHFKNQYIVIVGGRIINSRFNKTGISIQEETYISRENRIKHHEGLIWGSMAGAFGGCYAIRKSWYSPVPPRFFMDDFYISMSVLENGGKCIMELDALCYEDVSNKLSEEFRRKVRISIGNFQNLKRYYHLLFSGNFGVGFTFFSHKVLRWFGPIFLIFLLLSNVFLVNLGDFYQLSLVVQLIFLFLPLCDYILGKFKVNINLLRFFTHFYSMNLALLIGFLKFLKGVESNIWQPTQRLQ